MDRFLHESSERREKSYFLAACFLLAREKNVAGSRPSATT